MSTTIIIEFGQFYTKVGLGYDNTPLRLLKTYSSFKFENIELEEDKFEERELSESNRAEKINQLHDYLDDIFYNILTTTPYEKKVFIGLNLLCNRVFVDMLMEVFFERLKVESVLFLPNEVLPIYLTGVLTGLVIDSGFTDTRVMPIYEGMMMKRSFRFTPIGGLEVCRKINQNYKSLPAEESHHTIIEKIDDLDFLTTISHENCHILPYSIASGDNLNDSIAQLKTKKVEVYKGRRTTIDLFTKSTEVYFSQDGFNDIVDTILEAIRNTPKKMRVPILQNIVLCGGGFLYKGMVDRLRVEMIKRAEANSRYNAFVDLIKIYSHFTEINYPCNTLAWAGAKIYAQLNSDAKEKNITALMYEKKSPEAQVLIDKFFFI